VRASETFQCKSAEPNGINPLCPLLAVLKILGLIDGTGPQGEVQLKQSGSAQSISPSPSSSIPLSHISVVTILHGDNVLISSVVNARL
jgi:hypothetical protein